MADIYSNGTGGGPAASASSWDGGVVPGEGDAVYIRNGDTIVLDGSYIWGADSYDKGVRVQGGGVLKASRAVDTDLTVKGYLRIDHGGTLDYGRPGDEVIANAVIRLNYSGSLARGKYGLLMRGNLYIAGTPRSIVRHLAADAASGDTTISLDDASGIVAGDELLIIPATKLELSPVTVSSVSGNTVTLNSGMPYDARNGARVGILTSNVTIRSYDDSGDYNGFVRLDCGTGDEVDIANVALRGLGAKNASGDSWVSGTYKASSIVLTTGQPDVFKRLDDIAAYNAYQRFTGSSDGTYVGNGFHPFGLRDAGAHFRRTVMYTRGGWASYRGSVYRASGGINASIYGNGFSSSYSQGTSNAEFRDMVLYSEHGRGVYTAPAMTVSFEDCAILGSGSTFRVVDAGVLTFRNCEIQRYQGHDYELVNSSARMVEAGRYYGGDVRFLDCEFNPNYQMFRNTQLDDTSNAYKFTLSNKNKDPLQQEIYTNAGLVSRDNSIYRDSAPSVRAEFISDANALQVSFDVFAPAGEAVVVTGYVRVDSDYDWTGDIVVTLSGPNAVTDTFILDSSTPVDTWVQFKVATTNTGATDGLLELTISGRSAAGHMWVDDIASLAPKPVQTGRLDYWSMGSPVRSILANYVTADDVWTAQTSSLTVPGSIGDYLAHVIEAAIRGADNDDLKTLSDQLDGVQADLDNPDQYKADVSGLALEANVEQHVTDALNAYDPPTRSEVASDRDAIISHGDANWAGEKNTEAELHSWLDTYTNKDDWKTNPAQVADAVWDEPQADHTMAGSTGESLENAASGSGGTTPADVWAYANRSLTTGVDVASVSGTTVSGPDDLKADVSGLATQATADAIKAKTDNLPSDPASRADVQAVAAQVWSQVAEGALTHAEAVRIMLAVLAGKVDGGNTDIEQFYSQDGQTVRVRSHVDPMGNRTQVEVDGS